MKIKRRFLELTREARCLMSLLHCDLETFLGFFTLFDKYQEFYRREIAIKVFDSMSLDNQFNLHSLLFSFMYEVLEAIGSKYGFKPNFEIILVDNFKLDFCDKSNFKSDVMYYQIQEELRYFNKLIDKNYVKKEYCNSPKTLEKSQVYLTVLLNCNLDVLTGIFTLFDKYQEFYKESIECQLCNNLEDGDDIDSIVFYFMLEVLRKVGKKYSVVIDPLIIENKKFNLEKYHQEFYLQMCNELNFFEDLINKNFVLKLEDFKRKNTINFQLFGGGYPAITDFQDKEIVELIKNKTQVVIEKERISLRFQYPLLYWVVLEYGKSGGFTRLDLFERIHKGFRKVYAEQEPVWQCKLNEILVKGVIYNSQMNLFDVIVKSK